MVVEPSKEDLVRGKAEEVFDGLSFFAQAVELRMQLDVDLGEKTPSNDLPDETKDQMLATLCKVRRPNVDHGTADTLGRSDDDIVVFGDLESIKWFFGGRFVEHARIDSIGDGIVDQLAQDETVLALVEKLHRIGWDGVSVPNVWIIFNDLKPV